MIRRLLQALDADLLTAAISRWLASRVAAAPPPARRAISVDGKTLRGSGSRDTAARHVMAALDQSTGVVLASTDVAGKTNEITRLRPLLDQIAGLHETVVTMDALHYQRDHVTYLAERGAHWILTVKANQPTLHAQLTALPWQAVPLATPRCRPWSRPPRDPHPQSPDYRHRHRVPPRRPSTADPPPQTSPGPAETLQHRNRLRDHQPEYTPSQTRPARRLDPRATGRSRTSCTGYGMSPTTKTDPRSAPAPDHKS